MKSLVIICMVAGVWAEAPRFRVSNRALPSLRPARFRSERFEIVPTTTDSPTEPTTHGGPYPPSGWKPAGAPFQLPSEAKAPSDSYGAPMVNAPYPPSGWKPAGQAFLLPQEQAPTATIYGVPDYTYGAPVSTYRVSTTNVPVETTENPKAEKLTEPIEVQKSFSTYYILLPNGQQQKVKFLTKNENQNMSAMLQLSKLAPLYV